MSRDFEVGPDAEAFHVLKGMQGVEDPADVDNRAAELAQRTAQKRTEAISKGTSGPACVLRLEDDEVVDRPLDPALKSVIADTLRAVR